MLSYVIDTMQAEDLIATLAVLIVSVIAHELSHGYVAKLFGDPTAELQGRLTVNPLKHIDPIGSILVPAIGYLSHVGIFGWAKPVPYNPYNLHPRRLGEVMVAAAGPLTNFGIALVFGLLLRFVIANGGASAAFLSITATIVLINIVLGVFNSVPIPPLDGSKVLLALLPARYAYLERSFESYGLIILLVFILFFWSYCYPFIQFLYKLIVGVPF